MPCCCAELEEKLLWWDGLSFVERRTPKYKDIMVRVTEKNFMVRKAFADFSFPTWGWVGEGCIMTGSGQALRLAGFVVGCPRTKQSERNMFYHQGDDFSRTGDGEGKTSEDKSDDKSGKKS
eukprot:COSAG06_NODE_5350_length_3532_cov_40.227789_4_plen_121_part_00